MKKRYAILRLAKLKNRSAIGASDRHNRRTCTVKNADPSQAHLNRDLLTGGPIATGGKSLTQLVDDRIKDLPPQPRGIKSTQIRALQLVFTFSRGAVPAHQVKDWAQASLTFAKKAFGSRNIVQAVLHMDEATPHIHVTLVPVTADLRLCASEVFCRESATELQFAYPAEMARFGLVRGRAGSTATHVTLSHFYRVLGARTETLKFLEELEATVGEIELLIISKRAEVSESEAALFVSRKQLSVAQANLEQVQSSTSTLSQRNKEIEQQISAKVNEHANLTKELIQLKRTLLDAKLHRR